MQIVLFASFDDFKGNSNLWVTDGTADGTHELVGISNANANGIMFGTLFDLNTNMVVSNGQVLFDGRDESGTLGLWATDGTAAGTHEIAGQSSGVSAAREFAVFNDRVLFTDVSGNLWVTDGTAGGTHELTVSTASQSGLNAYDLTTFNGQLLFAGSDATGNSDLWVTDGTAAGTHELTTGIRDAYTTGPTPPPPVFDLTAFNGVALFSGHDTNGNYDLWVTDGTAAGTYQLTGISGAFADGMFSYQKNPFDFTPDFTVLNGEVLFDGLDATGTRGLWVTDGTAAGTHELVGISNANSNEFLAFFSPEFTVFNGKALFRGNDTNGHSGLWVTDGTAAGTHELVGISNANSNGLFYGIEGYIYTNMVVSNGQVLFAGVDGSGTLGLWATDGTAAGTHEITTGITPTLLTAFTSKILTANPPRNDFNGDGKSDVLWQNTDGLPAIWEMNGTSLVQGTVLLNPGTSWHMQASGNFDNDGMADIFLQNSDGLPEIWLMNGTSVTSTATLPNPGPTWHVIAAANFFGGAQADALWQNNDGLPAIWEMNGTAVTSGTVLPDPGPTWHAVGAGDFNGDGNADILWQNNDGLPAIWDMNGTSIVSAAVLPNPGPTWHAIGVGDFNGDGFSDVLWQNNDGLPAIWDMNGTAGLSASVLVNPGPSWHAIGTSDFNGDGKADILWQNNDGLPAIWEMNGFSTASAVVLPNPGTAWQAKDDAKIVGSLQYEIQSAESLITAQVLANPTSAYAKHLSNNRALVDEIANDIAAQFGTSQNYYQIGVTGIEDGFINPSSEDIQFLDQCVALVQALDHNVPSSTSWHPSPLSQVDLGGDSGVLGFNQILASGAPVPIATFNNGSPSGTYNGEHAAFFLGYGFEANQAGFFVLDQYNNPNGMTPFPPTHPLDVNVYEPAEVRFISFSDSTASTYYVIAPH